MPRIRLKFNVLILAALLTSLFAGTANVTPAYAAGLCYVSSNATGTGDGTSWTNAYTDLQNALSNNDCIEIWVKAGTYNPGSDLYSSFVLKNGVAIYGGFAGTETLRDERAPKTNVTILDGEYDVVNENKVQHVVIGSNTDSTAILDGFTIQNGWAQNENGAGMYIEDGSPTLRNLIFESNMASGSATLGNGGGMYNLRSSPTLTNVTFFGNSAYQPLGTRNGGGMYNEDSHPVLKNVTFTQNQANYGGAMFNKGSSPSLSNVTFYLNSIYADASNGSAIYNMASSPTFNNVTFHANQGNRTGAAGIFNSMNSNPVMKNVILWETPMENDTSYPDQPSVPVISDSVVQGGCPAGSTCSNIITGDPKVGLLQNNGGYTETVAIGFGSSAIDMGNAATCADTNTVNNADQRGVARGALCDIGSYELKKGKVTFNSIGSQDGWILESTETSNKGGKVTASGTTLNIGDDAGDKQYRAILSFNTELPAGSVITSATLKFKYAGKTGTLPFSTHGKLLVDVKKGAFSNNATLAKGDFNAAANKNALFSLGSSTNWFTKVFTSAQLDYINKTGVTQFRLRFTKDDNDDMGTDLLKIYSGSAGSNAPQLIIEYYVP